MQISLQFDKFFWQKISKFSFGADLRFSLKLLIRLLENLLGHPVSLEWVCNLRDLLSNFVEEMIDDQIKRVRDNSPAANIFWTLLWDDDGLLLACQSINIGAALLERPQSISDLLLHHSFRLQSKQEKREKNTN